MIVRAAVADVNKIPGQTRRERARATRRKIVDASRAEFEANGYHGTTMNAVAQRAGVAVQTVYFVFHTKAELLSATIDTAVLGDEDPEPPAAAAWWAAAAAEPGAREALRLFVAGTGPILARASGLADVARTAAQTDPDARQTHEFHEKLRLEGYRQIIAMLAEKGPLRAGLDIDGATDVLLTMLGPATYLALTQGRGWSHERVVTWLGDNLPDILLA
jgi:AcrR family transcriptional regulator